MHTDERARRQARTHAQLRRVCARIERILAGQSPTLKDLGFPHEAEPGETPLERLRRFKVHLNQTLAAIEGGDPALCRACHSPLRPDELDELPWATRCRDCPGS